MTMPMPKFSLMAGYALAFGAVAVVQVAVATSVGLLLGMTVEGSIVWIVVVMLVDAVLGVTLGLFASAFATTEFQAIQLMPVVVLPQLLLCGLFVPRDQMAPVLRWISDVLPVTYAVEALQKVATGAAVDSQFFRDVVILLAWVIGAGSSGRRDPSSTNPLSRPASRLLRQRCADLIGQGRRVQIAEFLDAFEHLVSGEPAKAAGLDLCPLQGR